MQGKLTDQIIKNNYRKCLCLCCTCCASLQVIFIVYMILVTLLLINMLIAMMGNTYYMVNEAQLEWLRQASDVTPCDT